MQKEPKFILKCFCGMYVKDSQKKVLCALPHVFSVAEWKSAFVFPGELEQAQLLRWCPDIKSWT